jgi:hypothetical protein
MSKHDIQKVREHTQAHQPGLDWPGQPFGDNLAHYDRHPDQAEGHIQVLLPANTLFILFVHCTQMTEAACFSFNPFR